MTNLGYKNYGFSDMSTSEVQQVYWKVMGSAEMLLDDLVSAKLQALGVMCMREEVHVILRARLNITKYNSHLKKARGHTTTEM